MKTLNEWLTTLYQNTSRQFGGDLSRLTHWVEPLQLTQLADTVITVTGTNGKGSVTRLLESIYLAAGFRVAAITSPHLMHFCERLTLDGRNINETSLIESFEKLESLRHGRTYNVFDFIYCALYYCIKQFKPQVVIVEAGIGGRLDASNVLDSQAAVITSIAMDHVHMLGGSRESIAFEKAHLARPNCPFICGEADAPHALFDVVNDKKATLYQAGAKIHGFHYYNHTDNWDWFGPETSLMSLPHAPIHDQNAATALMVVDCLQSRCPIDKDAIREGLVKIKIPGRYEKHEIDGITWILDVAHNQAACEYLASSLAQHAFAGSRLAVIGLAETKLPEQVFSPLLASVDHWFTAPLGGRPSHSAVDLSKYLQALGGKNCYTGHDLYVSLKAAREKAQVGDQVVVCGSFLAVEAAKRYLEV